MTDPTPADPTVELRRFVPFSRLDDERLWLLSTAVQTLTPTAGEVLFRCGDRDEREYFLLDGQIRLIAKDGARRTMSAGDDIARHPIARLRPRQFTAIAVSNARLVVVETTLLSRLGACGHSPFSVVELEPGLDADAAGLLGAVQADLADNRLRPVVLAERAARLREQFAGASVAGQGQMRTLLRAEPWLSYRLLRALNDPILGAGRGEICPATALPLIGIGATRRLLHYYFDEFAASDSPPDCADRVVDGYREAVVVAHIAEALAAVLGEYDPESAYVAGLLHNLGELVALRYRAGGYGLDDNVCAHLSALLLIDANLPERLVTAVRDCRDWQRDRKGRPDLCDMLIAARALAAIGRIGPARPPRFDRIPACRRLGVDRMDPARVAAMLHAARSRAQQILA